MDNNNNPTPQEIASAISSFATTAIMLHEAKILSDENITKANAVFGDFLDKVKAKVDSLDFTKEDNQNQNNCVPPAPVPMPPVMQMPDTNKVPDMATVTPPMPVMDNPDGQTPVTPPIDTPTPPAP